MQFSSPKFLFFHPNSKFITKYLPIWAHFFGTSDAQIELCKDVSSLKTQPEAKPKTEYVEDEGKNGKTTGKVTRHATDRIKEADIGTPEAQAESLYRISQRQRFEGNVRGAAKNEEQLARLVGESPKAAERVRELDAENGTVVLPPPTEQPTAQPETEPIIEQQKPAFQQAEQANNPQK